MNSRATNHAKIFYILALSLFPFYIYHNPVRWIPIFTHFTFFFFGLHPNVLWINGSSLAAAAVLFLSGYGYGIHCVRWLTKEAPGLPRWLIAVPLGWGILANLIFGAALLQWLATGVIGSLVGAGAILGLIDLARNWQAARDAIHENAPWFWNDKHALVLGFLIAIPIYFAFCSSLMPPTQSDGLRYHLTVPKLYLQHGGFYQIPNLSFSNFPFLIEYLFLFPLSLGLVNGPKLIHFCYFIMVLCMVFCLGKRLGGENKADGLRIGLFAALFIVAIPFVPIFASWSFIEFGLTCYALLGFALCLHFNEMLLNEKWREGGNPPLLNLSILIGIIGGLAVSCKYTALAMLGFVCIAAALPMMKGQGRNAQRIGFAALIFIVGMVVASPWFVKNALLLGNPVHPFAKSLFPTPGWSEFNAEFFAYHAGMKGDMNAIRQTPLWWQMWDFATLPFRVTFFSGSESWHADNFGAWPVGAAWLIVLPLSLLRSDWFKGAALYGFFSFMLFLLWAMTYRDTRFLLPCFVILAPWAAWTILPYYSRHWIHRPLILGIVLYGMAHTAFLLVDLQRFAPWQVISGQAAQDEYLEQISSFTRFNNQAFRYLKEHASPDDTVLIHGTEQLFYCPNRYIAADWFNTDPLAAWSQECETVDALIAKLQQEKIRYIVYNYGNIQRYNTDHQPFYRFFCLPEEASLPLLREWRDNEKNRIYYPYVHRVWSGDFLRRLNREYQTAPNVNLMKELLDSGRLEIVFRYDEDERNPFEGISVLKMPIRQNQGL